MVKIKNILKKVALILAGTLLVASCDIGGSVEKEAAYLVVKGNVARIANPDFGLDTFTDITLSGVCNYDSYLTLEEQEVISLGNWQSDEGYSAVNKFYEAYITVPIEKANESWTFFVKASRNATVFESSVTTNVAYGPNYVDFSLKLTEYSTEGEGGINIDFVVKDVPVQLEKYDVYNADYDYYYTRYNLASDFDYKVSVDLIPFEGDSDETITTVLTPVPVIEALTEEEWQNAEYIETISDYISFQFTYEKAEIPSGVYFAKFIMDKGDEYEHFFTKDTLITVTDGVVSKESSDFDVTIANLENAIETTKHTITFDLNGGVWEEGFVAPEYYYTTYASSTLLPTDDKLSRTDCVFLGWRLVDGSDDFVTEVEYSLDRDVVYKAIWTFADSVVVEATSSGSTLTWTPVPCATEYEIYYKTNNVNDFTSEDKITVVTDGTSYDAYPLIRGNVYYAVKAVDSNFSKFTDISNTVRFDALASSFKVQNITFTFDDGRYRITWDELDRADSYTLAVSSDGEDYYDIDTYEWYNCSAMVDVSQTGAYYIVKAYNEYEDYSSVSNEVVYIPGLATPVTSVNGASVSWNYVNGATEYKIYVSFDGNSYENIATVSENSYDCGVSTSERYVKVAAYNNVSYVTSGYSTPKTIEALAFGVPVVSVNDTTLAWDAVENADTYEIYSSYDNIEYSYVVSISNTYYDVGLSVSDRYFKVRAYNSEHNIYSEYCNFVTVDALSLSAPEVYLDGTNIRWNSVNNADGYYVYYSTDGENWNSDFTSSTYYNIGISADERYFKVEAYNSSYSVYSNESNTVTVSAFGVPELSVSGTTISWNSVDSADYYKVYSSTDGESWSYFGQEYDTSYDVGLFNDERYFKVHAYNSTYYVESADSNTVTVSAFGVPELSVSGTTISWNSVDSADYYNIYVSIDNGSNYSYTTTIYEESYDCGSFYGNRYYKVNAYNSYSDLYSNLSEPVLVEGNPLPVPTLTVSGTLLAWEHVDDYENYKIYVSENGEDFSLLDQVSDNEYDAGLSDNGRYFKITNYNYSLNAESDYSNVVTIDAFATTGLTVSGTTLSWDSNSYASRYDVYVSDDGENFSYFDTAYSPTYEVSSSYSDKYYMVKAYNEFYTADSQATNIVMVEGTGILPSEPVAWTLSSTDTYYFTEGSDNVWSSNNQNIDSTTATTTWTITLLEDVSGYRIPWSVSSESRYDKITIILDTETKVDAVSGESNDIITVNLTAGTHTITAKYSKDGSQSDGTDTATITLNPITYN